MEKTLARRDFKKLMGQTNHYIITARVGLWAIENNPDDFSEPEDMHAAWNPKNKESSARRTEAFILKSSLAWTVTCLDSYFSQLNRKPKYIQDAQLIQQLDANGRSVYRKFIIFNDHYQEINPSYIALVDLLITWRNAVIHRNSGNRLLSNTIDTLQKNSSWIEEQFCGLKIDGPGGNKGGLADRSVAGDPLTFKETASLIAATQYYVQDLDRLILRDVDTVSLARESFLDAISNKENERLRRKFKGLDKGQPRFLRNWLAENVALTELTDTEIEEICILASNSGSANS